MVNQENRCEDVLTEVVRPSWWDLLELGQDVISSCTIRLFIQFQFPEIHKYQMYIYESQGFRAWNEEGSVLP